MPLILPPKSRKMPLREYAFSKFPGGPCPRTPLGIACQRHARVGLRPTYPPIIARFPPVKNFSYIPELYLVKPVVQLYFGRAIAHFILGHHLGFGNCGGLGRENIWRGNRHEVETMGKGGGERKMLYYFTCTTPKPPL